MKPVKLTWLDDDNRPRTDNLFLMEDGDKFFGETIEGEVIPVVLDDIVHGNDPEPLVWFGGVDGLVMGIEPQFIVLIEEPDPLMNNDEAMKIIKEILRGTDGED